jgi:hypothetical protein
MVFESDDVCDISPGSDIARVIELKKAIGPPSRD